VTKNKTLRKVMLHEHNKPDGTFDEQKLEDFISGKNGKNALTPQQRRILANWKDKDGKRDQRLIVFVTFYDSGTCTARRMGADMCALDAKTHKRLLVHANASFSVFWTKGPGKDVVLVLHTDYLVVNRRNSFIAKGDARRRNTPNWLSGTQKIDGKPVQAPLWLKKDLERPVQYKLALWKPSLAPDVDEGVIYLYPLTPKGEAIMPSNGFHGMINTMGCWMLFRNWNWPAPAPDQFLKFNHVHNDILRRWRDLTARFKATLLTMHAPKNQTEIDANQKKIDTEIPSLPDVADLNPPRMWRTRLTKLGQQDITAKELPDAANDTFEQMLQDALDKLGYDVKRGTSDRSSSRAKFRAYDSNYAYAWFMRHVVGVKCFSETWYGGKNMNFHNVHGRGGNPDDRTFPLAKAGMDPSKDPDNKDLVPDWPYIHHSGFDRAADDKSWKPVGSELFTQNALGFQTLSSFVTGLGDAAPSEQGKTVDDCFWADLYFFKNDDAPWPPPFPDDDGFKGD
jgi:hypothetical protein